MGLISEEVEVVLRGKNVKYYENLGYTIFRKKDKNGILRIPKDTKIKVKVEDLMAHSQTYVNCECNNCKKILKNIQFQNYKKSVHEDGTYYCHDCALKLYGGLKQKKTKLKDNGTLGYWLIKNLSLQKAVNIITRWDYEKNNCDIREIGYGSRGFNRKGYYFKCPRGIHLSEIKSINSLTSKKQDNIDCNMCSSFAQWGYDNIDSQFLEKYWDYKKDIDNNGNSIDPWIIPKYWNSKVWLFCQEDSTHRSYFISCTNFVSGWRCASCSLSKGEKRIEKWFKINNFVKNEDYTPQKEFDELIGVGGGNLSYDFYLPKYNLLIEYQGEQHEKYIKGFHKSKKDFEKQVEHDRRKDEYADRHKIKLLPIWYWDFDNIEEILDEELNINKLKEAFKTRFF